MLTLVSAASKTFADNTSPVNPWLKINEFKFTFFIGSNLKALLGPEPAAVARDDQSYVRHWCKLWIEELPMLDENRRSWLECVANSPLDIALDSRCNGRARVRTQVGKIPVCIRKAPSTRAHARVKVALFVGAGVDQVVFTWCEGDATVALIRPGVDRDCVIRHSLEGFFHREHVSSRPETPSLPGLCPFGLIHRSCRTDENGAGVLESRTRRRLQATTASYNCKRRPVQFQSRETAAAAKPKESSSLTRISRCLQRRQWPSFRSVS